MAEKDQKPQEEVQTTAQENNLTLAIDLIESTESELKALLVDKHEVVLLSINTQFRVIKNRLRTLAGMSVEVKHESKLEPIKDFMGADVTKKQTTKAEQKDLTPKELEIKNLTEKADKLQEALPTLTNEVILESYQNDPTPIRLLAKRAGLTDYKDAKIDSAYLDLIRNGFDEQQTAVTAKAKDENALKNQ